MVRALASGNGEVRTNEGERLPCEHVLFTIALLSVLQQLISRYTFFLEDTPHLPWRNRHVNVTHAKMSEGINNSIDYRLRSANRRRLTNSLGSDRMMW